jgi:hypothetical protein
MYVNTDRFLDITGKCITVIEDNGRRKHVVPTALSGKRGR